MGVDDHVVSLGEHVRPLEGRRLCAFHQILEELLDALVAMIFAADGNGWRSSEPRQFAIWGKSIQEGLGLSLVEELLIDIGDVGNVLLFLLRRHDFVNDGSGKCALWDDRFREIIMG